MLYPLNGVLWVGEMRPSGHLASTTLPFRDPDTKGLPSWYLKMNKGKSKRLNGTFAFFATECSNSRTPPSCTRGRRCICPRRASRGCTRLTAVPTLQIRVESFLEEPLFGESSLFSLFHVRKNQKETRRKQKNTSTFTRRHHGCFEVKLMGQTGNV